MGGVNSKIHAKRLAQASEVLIELRGKTYTPFYLMSWVARYNLPSKFNMSSMKLVLAFQSALRAHLWQGLASGFDCLLPLAAEQVILIIPPLQACTGIPSLVAIPCAPDQLLPWFCKTWLETWFLVGRGATKGDDVMTHMQLDGEPWPQAIPAGKEKEPVLVRDPTMYCLCTLPKTLQPLQLAHTREHECICAQYQGGQ